MWEADFGRKPPLKTTVIAIRRPDYRCAAKVRRRTRRRVGPRFLRSVRTATRNFDLLLAIATLRLHTKLYVEIERFR
jgi:hypothetical protein